SASNVRFRAGSSIRGTGGSLHPVQDDYTLDFDIHVAWVSVAFTFGLGVQPIPPAKSDPVAGETGVVQVVTVTIMSPDECNYAYDVYGGITKNMICAGGKDVCQGVSGWSLVVGRYAVLVLSGRVSATGRSLVQRNPTDCDVCLSVIK
ncbi:hypothetical protein Cfor_11640, partial [Coptotermes formosanus]